jgi:hypothetical protein
VKEMSVDTLLQETKEFFRELSISEQEIEAVLNPLIGETEVLERKAKTFRIRRLKVDGEVECDLSFKSGVNVIKADNLKGKTSVLNIIKLSITGTNKLDQKLRNKVKEVFLEFQMDQETYTSHMCRDKKNRLRYAWAIYDMSMDEIVLGESEPLLFNKVEIIKFFMTQFGLPGIIQKKAKRDKLGYGKESVGFGDYFRAFYQDQEKGYTEIMSGFVTTRVSVMGVMMGLREIELLSKFDTMIANKETETKVLEEKLQTFAAYMENRYEGDRYEEKEIVLSRKKEDLVDLDSQKKAFLKSKISPIFEQIDSIEKTIETLENQQHDLQMVVLDLKHVESQLLRDIAWMGEDKASSRIFRPYFVRICPRCENEITVERLKLEEETQNCALCGNKMKPDEEKTRFMETEISERKENLDEIRKRINRYEKIFKTNIENLRIKKEEQVQLHKDLEKLRKEVDEKFLPKIVNINREMGKIEAEISELLSLKKNTSRKFLRNIYLRKIHPKK